jgi:hypothetical protein
MSFNSQKSSKEIPDIPIDLAEKILKNVFNECNKEPNKTPISVLMRKHKNSMRFHLIIISLCIIGLVFVLLYLLAFIRPQFSLNTQSVNQNMITMSIEVPEITNPCSVSLVRCTQEQKNKQYYYD